MPVSLAACVYVSMFVYLLTTNPHQTSEVSRIQESPSQEARLFQQAIGCQICRKNRYDSNQTKTHTNINNDKSIKIATQSDLIWDNPPYTGASLKERVLRALVKTSKPFSMLLPSSILHSKLLQDITDLDQVQCIIPRLRTIVILLANVS